MSQKKKKVMQVHHMLIPRGEEGPITWAVRKKGQLTLYTVAERERNERSENSLCHIRKGKGKKPNRCLL